MTAVAYADYAFYTNTYQGNAIAEADFTRLAARASAYINSITRGRVPNPAPESVKLATCAVAEAWQTNEQGGELQSQTVGPWSRTYAAKVKSPEARLYEAAALYLDSSLLGRWI